MNSEELGKYISATKGFSKPWLLVQLRLKKLQERKNTISSQEYLTRKKGFRFPPLSRGLIMMYPPTPPREGGSNNDVPPYPPSRGGK